MRGSLVVTFDEFQQDLGGGYYTVVVNGNETYRAYYGGMSNLYSSNVNVGDVVTVGLFGDTYDKTLSISRTDYTTDDENGDRGIKTTNISSTAGTTGVSITFTATTRSDAYGFEYKVDGNIDNCLSIGSGFTNAGYVNEVKYRDNKIYVGGRFLQYNGNNQYLFTVLDNSGQINSGLIQNQFPNYNGLYEVESIEFQSDGKLVIGGFFDTYSGQSRGCIVRLNTNYTLDTGFTTGFGFGGAAPNVNSIKIQPDGKIVCGGSFTSYNLVSTKSVCRLNSDGSLDTSFTGNTSSFTQTVQDLKLFNDGKILAVGTFTSYNGLSRRYMVKLNSDGSVDTTFVPALSSVLGSNVRRCEILPDGKILIAGNIRLVTTTDFIPIARFNSDGSLDTTFNLILNDIATDFLITNDNKIMLYTNFGITPGIIRLNYDGTIDNTFNKIITNETTTFYHSETLAQKPNGNILAGGYFTLTSFGAFNGLFEFTEDGENMMCIGTTGLQLASQADEGLLTEADENIIIDF